MIDLTNSDVQELLSSANHAVVSTHNPDGTILSVVVWIEGDGATLGVNSAVGRKWPTNLQNNPDVSVVIIDQNNPYFFAAVQGTATSSLDGADDQIDRLAKKYLGKDEYPFRQPGEQRIGFTITPSSVRVVKQ